MSSVTTDADIHDLVFELSETGATKLCIATCNSIPERSKLLEQISEELECRGIAQVQVHLASTNTDTDLSDLIKQRILSQRGEAVHVLGFDELTSSACEEVFAELNFRRDFLLQLGVPICFWLSERLLNRLVVLAPDFWSRRTAVYYFTSSSVEDLLGRLFGSSTRPQIATDTVGQAVAQIICHERLLQKKLNEALLAESISRIKDSIDMLVAECRRGGEFQVTLSLWNESQADEYIQQQFFKMRVSTREALHKIYADKNDVLFTMTSKIVRILTHYRDQLDDRISKGRKISLLGYFMTYAKYSFLDLLRTAQNEAEQQISFSQLPPTSTFGPSLEEQLRAEAVHQLESALSRKDDSVPDLFSDREVEVLRELYSAKHPKTLTRRMKRVLGEDGFERLEAKVRAFLYNVTP